jgi:TrwC relaxase
MHQGCVAGTNEGGRGAAGWWPTSPTCRLAGRRTTPASWPPTTSSICPATASPRDGGTAPAPPRSGCRAKHRRPGSRPCSRAATRRRGELLGRPHGRNAVPAFDVVLRPTKSVSVLSGLGDPVTGRAVLAAHHAGLAEAVAYLDEPFTAPRSPAARWSPTGCRWVAARRLPSMLRALPPVLGPERLAWLADQARVRFHPAA